MQDTFFFSFHFLYIDIYRAAFAIPITEVLCPLERLLDRVREPEDPSLLPRDGPLHRDGARHGVHHVHRKVLHGDPVNTHVARHLLAGKNAARVLPAERKQNEE